MISVINWCVFFSWIVRYVNHLCSGLMSGVGACALVRRHVGEPVIELEDGCG